MKKQYIIQLLFLLSLWACSDDENGQFPANALRISGTISGMNPEDAVTRFKGGTGVGVFVVAWPEGVQPGEVSLSGAKVKNSKLLQSADGLAGDPLLNWEEAAQVDVVAYYPYRKGMEEDPAAAPFQVSSNQNATTGNASAYEESDFLWAKTRAGLNTNPVQLTFKHLMTKVVVYLKSDAFTPGDMVGGEVLIQGTQTSAEIDLEKGTAKAVDAPGEIVMAAQSMEKTGYELAVKAIVVPQTVKANTQLLEIKTLGGYSYYYKLTDNLTFEPGKQMTLEVSIESGECHVTVGDITDWTETGDLILGEAMEDLPVFQVYDQYKLNGIQGIVVSVDETGTHGLVMSLDEARDIQWCTNITFEEENSRTDGMSNIQQILEINPTLEDYPAIKWCMDKNKDGVTGWYLPARDELKDFANLVVNDLDNLNAKIAEMGGTVLSPTNVYDDDWWYDFIFWSSSLNGSGAVRGLLMEDMYAGSLEISTPLLDQNEYATVRAFCKF